MGTRLELVLVIYHVLAMVINESVAGCYQIARGNY